MPKLRKITPDIAEPKKKRGRPKGSKNVPKEKTQAHKYDPDKEYTYWFIADACGCKIGANVMGSGMWCEHRNMMHLEDRIRYSEYEG